MNHRGGNRDDLPTLRVTNLSEDATEADLWELFARFGRVNRIYVGKDQDTGLCKGFAFVSFDDRSDAEKAMKKIDGLPYDHLILSAAFSSEFSSSLRRPLLSCSRSVSSSRRMTDVSLC